MHRTYRHPHIRYVKPISRPHLALLTASEKADAWIRSLREKIGRVSDRMRQERDRLLYAVRQRESHLAKLLADSKDAVVVTDDEHRLLAANQPALDLLGVSEKNMHKFTIDAFLLADETHLFEPSVPRFIHGTERHGDCMIHRMDGSLREVEFTFQANFVYGRHLSVLRDVTVSVARSAVLQDSAVT